MSKHKLSKTVLEMKFMKKTKIQQEKNDAEIENIEVLTDQKVRGGLNSNYVIERNWEFLEDLKCSRFNFGMSQKPATTTTEPATEENDNDPANEPPPSKRTKHIKFD